MQICAAMALRVGKIILKVKSAARAIIINNVNHASCMQFSVVLLMFA